MPKNAHQSMTQGSHRSHSRAFKRRGRLKNGNAPGDPSTAPRCGAKTRKGTPCQSPAMPNGRCRMHGGKSTGPRTPEGLERCRRANYKHGEFSQAALEEARHFREMGRMIRLAGNILYRRRRRNLTQHQIWFLGILFECFDEIAQSLPERRNQ